MIRRWLALALALALNGCSPPRPAACLLPTQKKMLSVEMYFGRAVEGRAPLAQTEWDAFAARELTPRFHDGFTVFDAKGQWMNRGSGRIGSEATIVVRAVVAEDATVAARVLGVTEAYKLAYHQVSVGVVSGEVCAAF